MSWHLSPSNRNGHHPQPDGHLQDRRAPSLLCAPQRCDLACSRILAAIPTPCGVLLSESQDGDQGRVSRAASAVTVSRSRAGGEGSPGQGSASTGGHLGTAHRQQPRRVLGAGMVHGERDGCWQCGGWGAQCANAGCYDRSICWLLVCLLFNFFLIQ